MAGHIEHDELERRFGAWQAFTPLEAKAVWDGLGLDWWVVGGLAVETFTGRARSHDDIDIGMWRDDVDRLVAGLDGRLDVWAAGLGAQFRSLTPQDCAVPEWADQVWLRESASSPWRADVLLSPRIDGRWVNRREPEAAPLPLEDITFVRDGIRWQRPELVLAFKAKHLRAKDAADFEAALPLLDDAALGSLRGFLQRRHPGHPWLDRL